MKNLEWKLFQYRSEFLFIYFKSTWSAASMIKNITSSLIVEWRDFLCFHIQLQRVNSWRHALISRRNYPECCGVTDMRLVVSLFWLNYIEQKQATVAFTDNWCAGHETGSSICMFLYFGAVDSLAVSPLQLRSRIKILVLAWRHRSCCCLFAEQLPLTETLILLLLLQTSERNSFMWPRTNKTSLHPLRSKSSEPQEERLDSERI